MKRIIDDIQSDILNIEQQIDCLKQAIDLLKQLRIWFYCRKNGLNQLENADLKRLLEKRTNLPSIIIQQYPELIKDIDIYLELLSLSRSELLYNLDNISLAEKIIKKGNLY